MEYNSKYGIVHFHDTSWNRKSLKGNSLEIDLVKSTSENTLQLINEFCIQKSKEQYILIASRIPATSIELKKTFFQAGFVTIEHTLDVSTCSLDCEKIAFIANRFPVIVKDYSVKNISEIENISAFEFNFGRFHEDPFIHKTIAQNRNKHWISDLITQNASIKVLMNKNDVVGFMAYKIKDNKVNIVLSAVKENYRHLTYGFIAIVFLGFKDSKEIYSLISSSNIDVLNLFIYFGFRFNNPRFGLHKHL